jgi:hypothetical protein
VPLAKSDNILTTTLPGVDNLAQSLTLGDTLVLGTSTVNSLRFAFNRTTVNRFNNDFFGPPELGINAYNYSPTKEMILSVTGGFSISAATATRGIATNNSYQVSDDLTIVPWTPPAWPRREPRLLDVAPEDLGARRRHVGLQRPDQRPWPGRFPAGARCVV